MSVLLDIFALEWFPYDGQFCDDASGLVFRSSENTSGRLGGRRMPVCRHDQSSYDKFRKERSRLVGFASPGNQPDHLRAPLGTESSQMNNFSSQKYRILLTVLSLLPITWQMSAGLAPQCQHLLLCCSLTCALVLLLKSDVLDARVWRRPISLPSSATLRFLFVLEDEVPDELSAWDR
jgi:hypothetical protein